uniref:Uncharacterized protein n=1 Tax=viral metagenome TaxID=1070528 RepID=A0A6C0BE54_9ZZZZ
MIHDFVEIFDSNVEDIQDVTIIEERIREGYEIFFNDSQIKSQIANLVFNQKLSPQQVCKKADILFDILKKTTQTKESPTLFSFPHVHPIIKCLKHIHYGDDDDYNADLEFEQGQGIKMIQFDSFLEQFNALNRDTRNPYTTTSSKLYILMKPFSNYPTNGTIVVSNNIDAVDVQKRKVRLLGNVDNVYKGDEIDVVGFFTDVGSKDKATEIDIDMYMDNINSFDENEAVTVLFNDFVFDGKTIVTTTNGKIHDNKVVFSKPVRIHGNLTSSLNIRNNICFVFKKTYKNPFCKRDIFTKNAIVLPSALAVLEAYNFVIPSNVSQALYIEYEAILKNPTISFINQRLALYNFNIDELHENSRWVLDHIFDIKLSNKVVREVLPKKLDKSEPKIDYLKGFEGKNNIERLAHAKRGHDLGLSVILKIFKQGVENRKRALNEKEVRRQLERLKAKLTDILATEIKITCEEPKVVIVKQYSSLDKMREDDGNDCYFDSKYDSTQYSIKNQHKTLNDIEHYLQKSKEFANQPMYIIKKEAKAIFEGKRKVEEGHYALLKDAILKKEFLFVRKKIEGKPMWVKETNVSKCSATESFSDINQTSSCVFDEYDNVCKSVEEYRQKRLASDVTEKVNNMEAMLEFINGSLNNLDKVIKFYSFIINQHILRNLPFDQHYVQDTHNVDVEDQYEGEFTAQTFEELMNNLEGQDFDNAPMPLLNQTSDKHDNEEVASDIISIIATFLDIKFSKQHKDFMIRQLENVTSNTNVEEDIRNERDKLMKKVNTELYNANTDYKAKIDSKIEERLKTVFESKLKDHYYDELITAVSLIIVMTMALYPHIDIGRIVPKCSMKFSRIGHPFASDKDSKTLEAYIACSLKQIALADDIRYKLIIEKEQDGIEKDIRKEISRILDNDYALNQRILRNKQRLEEGANDYDGIFLAPLRASFRPCFEFTHNDYASKELKFLKIINDKIKKAKATKISIKKMAYIANSCCPEKLNENFDFFDLFLEDPNIKQIHKHVLQKQSRFNKSSFYPKTQTVELTVHNFKTITQTNTNILLRNEAKSKKQEPLGDDKYFNDVLLPQLETDFKALTNALSSTLDNPNVEAHVYIRDALVLGMNENHKSSRAALYNFTKYKLPIIMGRIVNQYKFAKPKEDNPFYNILVNITKNSEVQSLLPQLREQLQTIKTVFVESHNEETNVVKNIALLTNEIVKFLKYFITLAERNKINNVGKILIANICDFVLQKLYESLNNNVFDINGVLKKIEDLREESKQQKMNAYLADDEERQLQIELRNMGVENWSNIFDRIKNKDISDIVNHQDENANYMIGNYMGENADDDELDEDFARSDLYMREQY